MPLPTVSDVYQARRRLGTRIPRTPLLPSSWLSSIADGDVSLKIESLNLTHSFKIRGALNAALRLRDAGATPTIVAASAGNHGRAMALAAEQLGLPCVVFTPSTAPEAKQNAIRRHGAVLHNDSEDYDTAERRAKEFAAAEGGVYVSPYNNADVIAGAGTIGLELVEAMPHEHTLDLQQTTGHLQRDHSARSEVRSRCSRRAASRSTPSRRPSTSWWKASSSCRPTTSRPPPPSRLPKRCTTGRDSAGNALSARTAAPVSSGERSTRATARHTPCRSPTARR